MSARPRILYVVPGHDLLPSAGPTRNVLSLAEALSEDADVTVAFRRIVAELPRGRRWRAVEIEPTRDTTGASAATDRRDDVALRGAGLRELAGFLRALRRFLARATQDADLVLEKSWLFSGYVAERCGRLGVPCAVVENVVRVRGPGDGGLVRRARHELARTLVSRWLRRAPLVIAETDVLSAALVRELGVPAERVAVVGLGIDKDRFRPRDRDAAREELGLARGATILVYVGVLDRTHDLRPVIAALRDARPTGAELHVVGDGAEREALEQLARAGDAAGAPPVVFHGRVQHDVVPAWIAAADLFVAPYDRASFPGGEVAYSTLKIPEASAAGRPVASVASGRIRDLIDDGETGFLVEGDEASWTALLGALPDRERLAAMGRAAAERDAPGWDDVARAYLDACRPLLERRRADR